MSTITIGCRLPNGLVIDLGDNSKPSVVLAGQRQAQEGSPIVLLNENHYGVTEVDESFWQAWKSHVGEEYAPLKSQAIFEAKNEKEVKAIAKDLKKEKTGHEPLPQEVGDIKKA